MLTHEEITALYQRAQRACDGINEARSALMETCSKTQELLARARVMHPVWQVSEQDDLPPPAMSTIDTDPHTASLEALREMRDILNNFPLEQQVSIVKALAARTMLHVAEQLERRTALSA